MRIGGVCFTRRSQISNNTQYFYEESKAAAIQEAIEQRAPQSPSEISVTAIKASPVVSEDAKFAATAGNKERTTAVTDWCDIAVTNSQAEAGLDHRAVWIRDMTSAVLGLAY